MRGVNIVPGIKIVIVNVGKAKIYSQLLKVTMPIGDTNRADVVSFCKYEFKNFFSVILYPLRICNDLHVLPWQCDASRSQLGRVPDLDQAKPAGPAL
jgi:hypothetical protein